MTSVLCVGKGNKLQDYATSNKSYELAFGYLVNLSKTEVNYAANMQLKVEANRLQILRIQQTNHHYKHWGYIMS